MSGFISFLKRFGFAAPKIEETAPPPSDTLPANCHFITSQLLLVPFPSESSGRVLSSFLNAHHGNKFMIWNLSEKKYDTSLFNNQVLDYVYLGYPNPPLEAIFSVFTSIKGWLDTDEQNIAVIHCQLTQSRSHLVLSCFLSWFSVHPKSPQQALEEICKITNQKPSMLFPSNSRYLNYIGSVIRGDKPPLKQIKITRIILNGLPVIENTGPIVNPYFQVFKNSEMVFTSPATGGYFGEESSISIEVGLWIEGDVLIRCRHITYKRERLTLFKIMFNTSFVSGETLRFKKKEIDCANFDKRFPDDTFVDVFVEESKEVDFSQTQQFWSSLESARNREVKKTLLCDEEEEEKVDLKLIEKFKHLNDTEENLEEDDFDNYFKMLEKA